MANSLQQFNSQATKPADKVTFSQWLSGENVQNMIHTTLTDKKVAQNFVSSVCTAVATNPALQNCTKPSVLSAALLATSLGLSLSSSIGHCYLVPYEDRKKGVSVATFILGWRGYIQLATRTGYYDRIHVIPIKEGEIVKVDPINDEYIFNPIQDPEKREIAKTVGYYAFFQYNERSGGFRKDLYWSREKMLHHADRYSQAFHLEAVKSDDPKKARVSFEDYLAGKYPKSDEWKYSSFWYKDFDAMAMKTMVRQLIGKWGIMNSDFLKAYEADNHEVEYTDSGLSVQPGAQEADEDVIVVSGEPVETEPDAVEDAKPVEKRRGRRTASEPSDEAQSVQDEFFGGDDN